MNISKIILMSFALALAPLAKGQTLEVLHTFQGSDGSGPEAELIQGSDSNFYGTTYSGGTNGGWGTVFKVATNGVLTTLVSFNATNGSHPGDALLEGADGNFYGTTRFGGDLSLYGGRGYGTVFRMTPSGTLTTLILFNGSNGRAPGKLMQGSDGDFYGSTANGGNLLLNNGNGCGVVFKMTPGGILNTLAFFSNTNGLSPMGGLVYGGDGNFYGTTSYGGINGWGTVFQMTPIGALTSLFSFDHNNGSYLPAGLVHGKVVP